MDNFKFLWTNTRNIDLRMKKKNTLIPCFLISESSETLSPLASDTTKDEALSATSLTSETILSFSSLVKATAILLLCLSAVR